MQAFIGPHMLTVAKQWAKQGCQALYVWQPPGVPGEWTGRGVSFEFRSARTRWGMLLDRDAERLTRTYRHLAGQSHGAVELQDPDTRTQHVLLCGRRLVRALARCVPRVRFCRICTCTAEMACLCRDGEGCAWVEPDLCSACATNGWDGDGRSTSAPSAEEIAERAAAIRNQTKRRARRR